MSVYEAWGFSSTLSADVDVQLWLAALNQAALDRGITPDGPSDALDMSRDVILMDAAAAVDADYEVVGSVIRLWRRGLVIDWDTAESSTAPGGYVRVAEVDAYEESDWLWAVVADDDSVLERFHTEKDAVMALASHVAEAAHASDVADWKYAVECDETRLGLGQWIIDRDIADPDHPRE